jgi:glycopeptide antibiotics resistance protein
VILLSISPSQKLVGEKMIFEGADKIAHFGMYAFLTLFWTTALKRQNKSSKIRAKAFLIAMIGGFVLSLLLEIIQEYFIISRFFEALDLIANAFGCIFGVLFFKLIYRNTYR